MCERPSPLPGAVLGIAGVVHPWRPEGRSTLPSPHRRRREVSPGWSITRAGESGWFGPSRAPRAPGGVCVAGAPSGGQCSEVPRALNAAVGAEPTRGAAGREGVLGTWESCEGSKRVAGLKKKTFYDNPPFCKSRTIQPRIGRSKLTTDCGVVATPAPRALGPVTRKRGTAVLESPPSRRRESYTRQFQRHL